MTSSVLLNVAFVCNFAYLNYIMNFSKVNVRDLACAKYEDTYLLRTTKLRSQTDKSTVSCVQIYSEKT